MPSREIPPNIPSVGRAALYWPINLEKSHVHHQPFAAIIAHVHDDGRVNLIVFNEAGIMVRKKYVPFPLDRSPQSGEASFAT